MLTFVPILPFSGPNPSFDDEDAITITFPLDKSLIDVTKLYPPFCVSTSVIV